MYFHPEAEVSSEVLRALHAAGVQAVEYTNRGAAALENFLVLRQLCDQELPGMQLGVGTIKNKKAAADFIAAGADFIVTPGLVEAVIETAAAEDLLWVPGCMTPTEIIRAEQLGASVIKLFPGDLLGPGFLKAIRSLFPNLDFMPTGGVDGTTENLKGWFSAGVCAVGMGSKLISKDLLAAGDYDAIRDHTAQTMATIQAIRKNL